MTGDGPVRPTKDRDRSSLLLTSPGDGCLVKRYVSGPDNVLVPPTDLPTVSLGDRGKEEESLTRGTVCSRWKGKSESKDPRHVGRVKSEKNLGTHDFPKLPLEYGEEWGRVENRYNEVPTYQNVTKGITISGRTRVSKTFQLSKVLTV